MDTPKYGRNVLPAKLYDALYASGYANKGFAIGNKPTTGAPACSMQHANGLDGLYGGMKATDALRKALGVSYGEDVTARNDAVIREWQRQQKVSVHTRMPADAYFTAMGFVRADEKASEPLPYFIDKDGNKWRTLSDGTPQKLVDGKWQEVSVTNTPYL